MSSSWPACVHKACAEDPREARYLPGLEVWAAAELGGEPAQGTIGLPTCRRCRRLVTVDDVLTPQARAQIVQGFLAAGKAEPRRFCLVWRRYPDGATMRQALEALADPRSN